MKRYFPNLQWIRRRGRTDSVWSCKEGLCRFSSSMLLTETSRSVLTLKCESEQLRFFVQVMEWLLHLPKERSRLHIGLGQHSTSIVTLDSVCVCLLQGIEERVPVISWRRRNGKKSTGSGLIIYILKPSPFPLLLFKLLFPVFRSACTVKSVWQ